MPSSLRTLLVASAISICLPLCTQAHMQMSWPYPLRSPLDPAVKESLKDYDMTSPLRTDGSNFACKKYQDTETNSQADDIKAVYQAGETYNMSITGTATHMGGSCQISLSYDNGVTFKVIQSQIGGCSLVSTHDFTIPSFATSSDSVLLSWSWFNLIGNREMYQNCARVEIQNPSHPIPRYRRALAKREASLDDLPDMFVCNVGNGCTTIEKSEVVFPDPGDDVVYGEDGVTPNPGPGFTLTSSSTVSGSASSTSTSSTVSRSTSSTISASTSSTTSGSTSSTDSGSPSSTDSTSTAASTSDISTGTGTPSSTVSTLTSSSATSTTPSSTTTVLSTASFSNTTTTSATTTSLLSTTSDRSASSDESTTSSSTTTSSKESSTSSDSSLATSSSSSTITRTTVTTTTITSTRFSTSPSTSSSSGTITSLSTATSTSDSSSSATTLTSTSTDTDTASSSSVSSSAGNITSTDSSTSTSTTLARASSSASSSSVSTPSPLPSPGDGDSRPVSGNGTNSTSSEPPTISFVTDLILNGTLVPTNSTGNDTASPDDDVISWAFNGTITGDIECENC